jgi:hypothetical protein
MPERIDPITYDPVSTQCDTSPILGLASHSILDERLFVQEPTAPLHARASSTSFDVEVKKFNLDWGTSRDLGDVTGERFSNLGHLILRGAWFLNPLFSVNASIDASAPLQWISHHAGPSARRASAPSDSLFLSVGRPLS